MPITTTSTAVAPVAGEGEAGGLERLTSARSVEALRDGLRARYPAFSRDALERLAVVGSAGEAARLVEACGAAGIEIAGVYDSNTARFGKSLGGHMIELFEAIEALDRETPVVICTHRILGPCDRLAYLGFESYVPLGALQVMHPELFEPHMFYAGWMEDLFEHRDRYLALPEMLADELSRETLDRILQFRLSFDVQCIRPIIDWNVYYPQGIISCGDEEVYVDGGAYAGDTVNMFINRTDGRFRRVLAFEPDPKTFVELRDNFRHDDRVEPIESGLFSRSGSLHFDDAGTRGSILVESGGIEIPVTRLDEILNGDPVTYIKMNIEGAELDALQGAARSIASWHPKLAISGYHRPSDLWQVPFAIRDLHPGYRLYLRQHDGGVIETVVYAV